MICPFSMHVTKNAYDVPISQYEQCSRNDCELWINSNYSTEHLEVGGMCAFKAIAMKNSEGHIVV
jgi:hypothetical protein